MPQIFHQKRFFPFEHGAPSIHTLRVHPSKKFVLTASDRHVRQLHFDSTSQQYRWDHIPFSDDAYGATDVIATGVIACPGRERIVVAYAEVGDPGETGSTETTLVEEPDQLFLSVVDVQTVTDNSNDPPASKRKPTLTKKHSVDGTGVVHHDETNYSIRFELVAAPTVIMSVRAKLSNANFHGVILFRMESMVAIGFLDDLRSATPSMSCVRLSNDQFAAFFPEFAAFEHPVLAVDTLELQAEQCGWIAMGCADGFIRVFSGALRDGILTGPYEYREMHVDGPVLSVSLFTSMKDGKRTCNLVAACAIGHAIVYEDLFGQSRNESIKNEVLVGSDQYETIFSALAADIDLDGTPEMLIGTDNQSLLAYKRRLTDDNTDKAKGDDPTKWMTVSSDDWSMRGFGGIYSLAWLDLNGDGVNELVIASSTGVYVYEADPRVVLERLEAMVNMAIPTEEP